MTVVGETEGDIVSGQALRAIGIRKLFAGVPALDGVDLTVQAGKVTGLVGHNGAGKSTLLKVLSGAYQPDGGDLLIGEEKVSFSSPATAIASGIATVYQELSLLPNLTIAENAFLGRELAKGGRLDKRAMNEATHELITKFAISADPNRRVGDYPVATRQLLEIAIATSRQARFLLLDEPTTSLEGSQVESLLEMVKNLAKDEGLGIVFINHKLDELFAVSDEVVALVNGKVRIQGPTGRVDRAEVIRAIAGSDVGEVHPPASGKEGGGELPERPIALRVDHLQSNELKDVTLQAREGSVLGIYGLVGSGRTEFLRTLVGLLRTRNGAMSLYGSTYQPRGVADAQRQGVVYLTEERKIDGIVPALNSITNVVLPVLQQYTRLGLLDHRKLRAVSTDLLTQLGIRGDIHAPVVTLSGGNQQKVLLARALAQRPRVLLLDEPTKGVDIGVKSEIHQLLRKLAHETGLAVVVVSGEEEEILEVADEVVTFTLGTCTGQALPASRLTVQSLRHEAWNAA
ncbi:MAG: sugar ABC transporter ATP-binding protein [Actinobacteria bacterium]|nr:sugar ABC transporter ATP-binding protein [Propionicimonas sp.]MBU3976840.1 sugar ABC transporter ATP-binding protein [Actinomycetota bacterium]MBU3986935.1 sugar ABC transporter ATP-binding protein [Actinomycetota bacterium]MBU4006847.1 sugar ABC transporter ATP-binding protein [Actinomycetota bacterium]MBU4065547.1 sugar ABC transporter ATP-binding protein [Actinomycetota bacterium]